MSHIMIDLEGLATSPKTCILTIAAQAFDPFKPFDESWYPKHFYARVDLESQADREIDESTVNWWASQPAESQEEAFGEDGRVSLSDALDGLARQLWNCKLIWCQGPTYDCTILEDAYRSLNKPLPWRYYQVRDSRTLMSLWPERPTPPASHHALEDCRRQIVLVQQTLKHLNVTRVT